MALLAKSKRACGWKEKKRRNASLLDRTGAVKKLNSFSRLNQGKVVL